MTLADPLETAAETSAAVLDQVRASRQREHEEGVRQLLLAAQFASFHSPDALVPAATLPGTDQELTLAGEGAPGVTEFAVVEFAAACGLSLDAGRAFLGAAIEARYRLPRLWAELRAGHVPAWRLRRVAARTTGLTAAGADWVDDQVSTHAGRIGPAALDRLVEEAILRFDPITAAERAAATLETRHAELRVDQRPDTPTTTATLEAVLDLADGLDLDAAITDLAHRLAAAGSTDTLDVRRSRALGLLARGEHPLAASTDHAETGPDASRRREVVLHVHLSDAALRAHGDDRGDGCGDGLTEIRTATGQPYGLVTADQVRTWCGRPDAVVVVRPVLDLAEPITSSGYQPSARLRDLVIALNPRCVFPHCTRPSERLDLDHIQPYGEGGATSDANLAPLCRRHHRAKTFGGWTYTRLSPGEHLWTGPHGHQWTTDPDGTTDLGPPGTPP